MTYKIVANEVVVNHITRDLTIDGVVFPYHIDQQGPEVEVVDDFKIGVVRIGILAENVRVVTREGSRSVVKAALATELEWARRRGREIVAAGMADTLTWLRERSTADR